MITSLLRVGSGEWDKLYQDYHAVSSVQREGVKVTASSRVVPFFVDFSSIRLVYQTRGHPFSSSDPLFVGRKQTGGVWLHRQVI